MQLTNNDYMASGKDHDSINAMVALAFAGASILKSDLLYLDIAAGIVIGTVWLSPDLDLAKSNPTNRLGVFKSLLAPYRKLCGHHRSLVSHSPILSSLFRVYYFLSLPLYVMYLNGYWDLIVKVTLDPRTLWVLVGLEIATDLHLVLDFTYSETKRIKNVFN